MVANYGTSYDVETLQAMLKEGCSQQVGILQMAGFPTQIKIIVQ